MGKFDAKVFAKKDGKEIELKTLSDLELLDKYSTDYEYMLKEANVPSNIKEFEEINDGWGNLNIKKQKDGKYYWTFTFENGKVEEWPNGFNTPAEAQKDFMYRSKFLKETTNSQSVKSTSYNSGQFAYKLVPKKIKGSGIIVKQLFEKEEEEKKNFQLKRIEAFKGVEEKLNNIYAMISNAKNETIKYYKENPNSYVVIKPTDLITDYLEDIEKLLKNK